MSNASLPAKKNIIQVPKAPKFSFITKISMKVFTLITKYNAIDDDIKIHFEKELQTKVLEKLNRVEVLTRML